MSIAIELDEIVSDLFFDHKNPTNIRIDFEAFDIFSSRDQRTLHRIGHDRVREQGAARTSESFIRNTWPSSRCIIRPLPQTRPFEVARYTDEFSHKTGEWQNDYYVQIRSIELQGRRKVVHELS